jgi:hypothetical protein
MQTMTATLGNLLSKNHGLRVFCDACKRVTLPALTIIAATPSLADMQPIDGYVIDRTEVTVGQFRKFVDATGYTIGAEKNGGGLVYSAGPGKMDGWISLHKGLGMTAAFANKAHTFSATLACALQTSKLRR